MFNHNLEIVQTVGQENPMVPFFVPPNNYVFLVSNQHFIINKLVYEDEDDDDGDHKSVTIINRSNGLVEASFVILEDFHQINLYIDKFLITFNQETCLLKCYNFKGALLDTITLDKKLQGSHFSVINKELCFVIDGDIFFVF